MMGHSRKLSKKLSCMKLCILQMGLKEMLEKSILYGFTIFPKSFGSLDVEMEKVEMIRD